MITYADLKDWDAAELTAASETFEADLRTLESARDTLQQETVPDSWVGLARISAEFRQMSLVNQMTAHIEEITDFEREVFSQVGPVQRIVDEVADIETTAAAQQFSIGSDGTVTDVSTPPEFTSIRVAENWSEERVRLRDALVLRVEEVLDDAFAVDSALVGARPACVFNEDEPDDVVDPEVERAWSEMSDEERERVVIAMAEELARQAGVEDFEVRIEDLEDKDGDGDDDDPGTNSYGSWNEGDRILRLDVNDLDDPSIVIDTVAHEVRHAEQHRAVDDLNAPWFGQDEDIDLPPGATLDDVRDWDENFSGDNYVTIQEDPQGYLDQPVEVDARGAGADYLSDYDTDDLERHLEDD